MMTASLRRAAVLLSIVLLVIFSGCGRKTEEGRLKPLTIAMQEWVGYGPLYLAKDKGFFRDEGVEVIFVDEQLDSARSEAFKEGMLDCEAGTIDLLISKRSRGAPVVAVMELDHSDGADGIVAVQDIRTLEDLVGKRVALSWDDVGQTLLSYFLYKKGMLLDKVVVVSRRPDEVDEAFLSGEADAVATWEPHLSHALKRPGSHLLLSSKDAPDTIVDTLNVREDLIKNDPQAVRALMRGWFRALKYYREHPAEASAIIAPYYKMSAEQYRKDVKGLRWIDYADQAAAGESDRLLATFNAINEIKFLSKRIPEKQDPGKAINTTLLKGLHEDIK